MINLRQMMEMWVDENYLLDPSNIDMSCDANAIAVFEKRHESSLSARVSEA